MKVVLTNLSNHLYEDSRKRLNDSAKKFGIEEIYSYDISEIKNTNFYQENIEILSNPKGIGYWLWKPYIILEALKKVEKGDIVIYCDCGLEILESLSPLISICNEKEDILLFRNANDINLAWVKRDCFILMDCDCEEFWNGAHCDASLSLYKKSNSSMQFVTEWLNWGTNKYIISDYPNVCGKDNLPGFIDHRWDQAILSLLALKNKIELYRMPTQFGNFYKMDGYRVFDEYRCINQSNQKRLDYYSPTPLSNSPYFQLLNHHRIQNKLTKWNKILIKLAHIKRKIKETKLF